MTPDPSLFILCLTLGFAFEFLDSSLGGGYGTILTPLFMLLGYPPLEIIPIILLSETITGLLAGALHNRFGNVDKRAWGTVTIFAILGSILGVTVAVVIPGWALKTYIGLLVLIMGSLMLWKHIKRTPQGSFSGWRSIGIGSLCGFNKALSGGGFGPVATSGLFLSGLDPKKAVGSATLAEGSVCLFAIIAYEALFKSLNWSIAIPLITGAILASYPASYATSRLPHREAGIAVGIFVVLLGAITLIRMVV